ncbi:unnamed protein product, partial [Phaeothamnion confervicola]
MPSKEGGEKDSRDGSSDRNREAKDDDAQYVLPGLDCYLRNHGFDKYAEAAVAACVGCQADDVVLWSPEEASRFFASLLRLKGDDNSANIFGDASPDGWTLLCSSGPEDWQDGGSILSADQCDVVYAVIQGWLGGFGTPVATIDASHVDGQALADRQAVDSFEALRASELLCKEKEQGGSYGELIVLGYREYLVREGVWLPIGTRNDKFPLRRRDVPNGLKAEKPRGNGGSGGGGGGGAATRRMRFASHSLTMSLPAGKGDGSSGGGSGRGGRSLTVDLVADPTHDIYQIGRMAAPQNDFVVRGPLHDDASGMLCGPVSRYAARITCNRHPPFECRLLAGGFNEENDLPLRQSAPKWRHRSNRGGGGGNGNGNSEEGSGEGYEEDHVAAAGGSACEWDAVTPFGVRLWKPETGKWREVSGGKEEDGCQVLFSSAGVGLPASAVLTDGCIIDLSGVQLLYRSTGTMEMARSVAPGRIIAEFNAKRPQCPVQLHTIRFEYGEVKDRNITDRCPFIYPACGHVHAFADEVRQ